MRDRLSRWNLAALSVCLVAALLPAAAQDAASAYPFARETANPTALDRYVAKPDPNYKWELVRTDKEDGITSYTIDMTSQQWLTLKEVDRPVWQHWVTITVPDEVAYPTAMMFIDGGGNRRGGEPRGADGNMKRLARDTKTIAAAVYMIPNQPLKFTDGGGWGRSEDALIAYTWDKYYRTGGEEWPARLPMTKAVVRAMDTVQAFCASGAGGGHEVKDFVVAGGSKRGWTTWTTGIVDTRVRGMVPCVIDLVNLIPSFQHHYAVYGFWSLVIGDYQVLGILDWLETPENASLMRIVDPYYYFDRLKDMPKLVMNAGNDQFFVPDSWRFYWPDLGGPKWLRYMPNVGHGLDRQEAYATLASFHQAVASGAPIPNYTFDIAEDGTTTVRLLPASNGEVIQPSAVKLWQAHNPKSRDYRGGKAEYIPSPVQESEPGVYRVSVSPPEQGWIGYFVELTFPGPKPELPFKFTSGIRSVPDTTPAQYKHNPNPPKGFITGQQNAAAAE